MKFIMQYIIYYLILYSIEIQNDLFFKNCFVMYYFRTLLAAAHSTHFYTVGH